MKRFVYTLITTKRVVTVSVVADVKMTIQRLEYGLTRLLTSPGGASKAGNWASTSAHACSAATAIIVGVEGYLDQSCGVQYSQQLAQQTRLYINGISSEQCRRGSEILREDSPRFESSEQSQVKRRT